MADLFVSAVGWPHDLEHGGQVVPSKTRHLREAAPQIYNPPITLDGKLENIPFGRLFLLRKSLPSYTLKREARMWPKRFPTSIVPSRRRLC